MDKNKEIIGAEGQSEPSHPFIFKTIGGIDVSPNSEVPERAEPDPKGKDQKKIKEPKFQLKELKHSLQATNRKAARGRIKDLKILGQRARQKYGELEAKKHRSKLLGTGEGIVQLRREIRKQRHLHPKRRISCQICRLKVNDRKSLLAHCQSRHSIRPEEKGTFHCKICRRSFNSERQQNDHFLGKLHQKTYRKLHPSKN